MTVSGIVQGVLVSGRVAYLLSSSRAVMEIRHRARSDDPELYQALADLHRYGLWWASPNGTTNAADAEVTTSSEVQKLTTRQAANRLGITPRAVRQACEQGRLPATKTAGRWEIPATAITARRTR